MDLDKIYELINNIPVTEQNERLIDKIKEDLSMGNYKDAMETLQELRKMGNTEEKRVVRKKKEKEENKSIYPKLLSDIELEHVYMGLLLNDPKYIVKYYFLQKKVLTLQEKMRTHID